MAEPIISRKQCQTPFRPPSGNRKKGYGLYCSRPCFGAHRRSKWQSRFWSNVEKSETGCWLWTAGRRDGRYGQFCKHRRGQPAHRVAYEIANGPVPVGMWVLHHCDNPPCVRPDHLFLGKHKDNMKDRHEKGRYAVGEAHHDAVLTEESVRAIRSEYRTGSTTYLALGKKFGISKSVVGAVIRRDTWKHIG